jgi:2-keto-4-pentenoate hydratase/2-oxohepta-3-ene-1,7-dioic acid hydratase in catechol pathway
MRFATYMHSGHQSFGVRMGDEIADFSGRVGLQSLEQVLSLGEAGMAAVTAALPSAPRIPVAQIEWLPPLIAPRKAIAIGLNYVDHAAESQVAPPPYPTLFSRYPSSWVGHRHALVRPHVSRDFDYEGELVIVIGKAGRYIDRSTALDHVAGYSVFNDGSIRDFQFRTSHWTMGKNFDRSGAFGPEFVTADELPVGAKGLRLQTRLNGRVMQDASTSDMIFDVATLVATCSVAFTLAPGDIIISGTPAGVGFARDPKVFMLPGDVCEVEIEGIGTLINSVIDEPAQPSAKPIDHTDVHKER